MSVIAFAAVEGNSIGADPGITVTSYDPRTNAATDLANEVHALPADGYGQMDKDAADALLASMGFGRTGQWAPSDHQWAAEVEPLGS